MAGRPRTRNTPSVASLPNEAADTQPRLRGTYVLKAVTLCAAILVAGYFAWDRYQPKPRPSVLFQDAQRILDLQLISKEEPNNPVWPSTLADLYMREGHSLSAVASLKTALELKAPEVPARSRLYSCYIALEQRHLALREAERIQELQPESLSARITVADTLMELNRPDAARALLRAIPLDDRGVPRLASVAQAGSQPKTAALTHSSAVERDPAGSREVLAMAMARVGDPKRSLDLALKAIREDAKRQGSYLIAGQSLISLGRRAEALKYLTARPEIGDLRYQIGMCLKERNLPGDKKLAEQEFEAAVRLDQTLGRAWWELAQIRSARGDWKKAVEAYVQANEFGAERPRAMKLAAEQAKIGGTQDEVEILLGSYYQLSGNLDAALALYERRLKRYPDREFAYRQVAGALGALGRTKDRIAVLRRGLKRFPESVPLVTALAKTYSDALQTAEVLEVVEPAAKGFGRDSGQIQSLLASAYDSIGKTEEAKKIYRSLLPASGQTVEVRQALGQLLTENRDNPESLKEAIRLLEECVPIKREDINTYRALGLAYFHAGRYEESVLARRHVVDLSPGEGTSYGPLSESLTKTGEVEEAEWMRTLAQRYLDHRRQRETLRARTRRIPINPESIRALAEFLLESQAYLQAETEYQRLLKVRPGDRRALTRLAEIYALLGRRLDREDTLRALREGT